MGINVLFVYPNTYGMNMLPPAIALFSSLLKERGHKVKIFDSTNYQTGYGIDPDGTKMDFLDVVPYDLDGRGINLRNTNRRTDLIVLNTIKNNKVEISDFERQLLDANSKQKAAFQAFLAQNKMSSHC